MQCSFFQRCIRGQGWRLTLRLWTIFFTGFEVDSPVTISFIVGVEDRCSPAPTASQVTLFFSRRNLGHLLRLHLMVHGDDALSNFPHLALLLRGLRLPPEGAVVLPVPSGRRGKAGALALDHGVLPGGDGVEGPRDVARDVVVPRAGRRVVGVEPVRGLRDGVLGEHHLHEVHVGGVLSGPWCAKFDYADSVGKERFG